MNTLVVLGASRPLLVSDLGPPVGDQQSGPIYTSFQALWTAEVAWAAASKKEPRLSRVLYRLIGPFRFWSAWFAFCIYSALQLLLPQISRQILGFISGVNPISLDLQILYVAGFFVVPFLSSVSKAYHDRVVNLAGTACQSAVRLAVYNKALVLSSLELSAASSGQIVNMQSTGTFAGDV
jgi:hypothetical protein